MFEEQITEITDKIRLSTFRPLVDETVIITLKPWEYNVDEAQQIFKVIQNAFPYNHCLLKFDGITLESLLEDDLK